LSLTEGQAQKLGVEARTQVSPHLQRCCLILSANESYKHAAFDLETLTGMRISKSAQQRLVHRVNFADLKIEQDTVEELSADGGKVRLRTPLGKISEWKDYKVITLHTLGLGAAFQDNDALTDWVNRQPLGMPLTCLGDGHRGIWNLMGSITAQRREILDWYHLKENLYKIQGSLNRLERAESHLWKGHVDAAIAEFEGYTTTQVENFKAYLQTHRHRIPNYDYLQAEGVSIGSGAVESSIKQMGRRIKISGAQWKRENVPQVLRHRAAYLNGLLS
jgi:hypothetical protein